MGKLRSVSTSFWSDPFIEELKPTEKLLFIYLITNERTNMLGIYENSIRKISFETGINQKEIEKALEGFEKVGKVKYINNYVVLVNYIKYQNYNTNMKKSAIDVYNNLPKELKIGDLKISKDNPMEGFESLSNAYGMVRKREVEYEIESESEIEYKSKDVFFNSFWKLYPNKVAKEKCKEKFLKLSKKDIDTILKTLKDFIAHKPFKDYTHPNPLTYLNQKRWTDEIKPQDKTNVVQAIKYGAYNR